MPGFPANVPISLRQSYAKQGVKELFDWQSECLSIESLHAPTFQNFIYTAPTSAGKTLVAEILAACNLLQHPGKRALFIFPYVSSAKEKYLQLQSLWRRSDLVVKAFIGGTSSYIHGWSAAVCTIEKANSLVNQFIESDTLDEICTVVVDELHMLFDNERGTVVENIITKLLYASQKKGMKLQIIGMSATLDEHKSIAQRMNAKVYVSNFRPLKLQEYACVNNEIFDYPGEKKVRQLSDEFVLKNDIRGVIGMTLEAVLENKAVLIFSSTKLETQKNASAIGKYIKYCIDKEAENRFQALNTLVVPPHQKEIVEYFRKKTLSSDSELVNCISYGVAYHHAGLTVEEREEIETLFRSGNIKVLVSTSTLSSGVNLPAHRVLIMASANAFIPLTSTTYKQMIGRAGRQGQEAVVSGW